MRKKNYKLKEIKVGDKIGIYINRGEGGASMGPSIEGKKKYFTYVTYAGLIGIENSKNNILPGHAYFDDYTPVGIPLSDENIYDVLPAGGTLILKEVMRQSALSVGGWAMKEFITMWKELPFMTGVKIVPMHDYHHKNKLLGVRNSHQVVSSTDIEFFQLNEDTITVYSKILNKVAKLPLDGFTIATT